MTHRSAYPTRLLPMDANDIAFANRNTSRTTAIPDFGHRADRLGR